MQERERRGRLRQCREEREKVVQEQQGRRTPVPQSAEGKPDRKEKDGEAWTGIGLSKSPEWAISESTSKGPVPFHAREDRSPAAEGKTDSLSLGDLSRYPATEKRLRKLVGEIQRDMSVTVPERDRKIATLMLAKHAEEQARLRRSRRAEQQREEARRQDGLRRAQEERDRRRELGLSTERWQREQEARRRRLQLEETQEAGLRERVAVLHEDRWRRLAEEQEARRRGGLEVARREAEGRKRCQEQQLKEREREERLLKEMQSREAQQKIGRASRSRLLRQSRDRRKVQLDNQHQRLKHLLLKKEVESHAQTQERLKRMALEQKLLKSSRNQQQVAEARLQKLKEQATWEEEQIQRAKAQAEANEREQQRHKEALARVTEHRIQQAAVAAEAQVQQRAALARQKNEEKERSHQLLWERLREEEAQLRRHLNTSIALKDLKTEQILREKEAAVEESRRVARASFHMRERVREQIHSRSFDQMALEAQLRASLTRIKL
ncbi:CC177 protein, partial [Amia calva]|nr:CC177 protein [Amia calva]